MGTDRVFVARLVGLSVFGPDGERIGRVRDAVVTVRVDASAPRVLGLVVELATRRRIFVPMLRVTGIDPSAVTLATGSVSLRVFTQRPNETLVVGQLLDAPVTIAVRPIRRPVTEVHRRQSPHTGAGRVRARRRLAIGSS